MEKKNPFQKGNSNDIYLGGTLNTIKVEYYNDMKSKFTEKGKSKSLWNNLYHYFLYASEGLLAKCLSSISKSFEIIVKEDYLRNEKKNDNENKKRRFIFFIENLMKYFSPKCLRVNF